MPELPDVETLRRYLDSTSLHRRIQSADARDARVVKGVSLKRLESTLRGREFESTHRHGKFLFVTLDRGPLLVLHFGMTGELAYFKHDQGEPAHTRLRIRFANGYRLAYVNRRRLGRVSLAENIEEFIRDEGLGPDALSVERDAFEDMLKGGRGKIKSALMNQNGVAGIGNVYADEILFQASVRPGKRLEKLTGKARRELFRAMRRVLKVAIRHRGHREEFPKTYLSDHREAGAECPKCGGRIRKGTINGRSTYYCPQCQT